MCDGTEGCKNKKTYGIAKATFDSEKALIEFLELFSSSTEFRDYIIPVAVSVVNGIVEFKIVNKKFFKNIKITDGFFYHGKWRCKIEIKKESVSICECGKE